MKHLLDTHALLWWLSDDGRLGQQARRRIADSNAIVFVSAASLWEIVVKIRVGKLEGDIDEICRAVDAQGFELLNITPAHLRTLANLPVHHRDPFDHLLVAQAISENAIFVTQDEHTPRYPVQFIACSD